MILVVYENPLKSLIKFIYISAVNSWNYFCNKYILSLYPWILESLYPCILVSLLQKNMDSRMWRVISFFMSSMMEPTKYYSEMNHSTIRITEYVSESVEELSLEIETIYSICSWDLIRNKKKMILTDIGRKRLKYSR